MKIKSKLIKIICIFAARFILGKPEIAPKIYLRYSRLSSFFKLGINYIAYLIKSPIAPYLLSLSIEPTNNCNLACRHCPRDMMKRKTGFIDLNLAKKIIDENPELEWMMVTAWGEPLLYKNALEIIEFASSFGIKTILTTNATLFTPELIQKILDGPLYSILISIDGIDQTYNFIRGFDYNKVKSNILELIKKRNEKKSGLIINIVATVYEENEKQIEKIINEWSGVADNVNLQPMFYYKKEKRTQRCLELYRGNLIIYWDGKVVTCCPDYDGALVVGNVNEEKIIDIWNGPKIRKLRLMHVRGEFAGLCETCSEYETELVSPRFTV